MTRRGAFQVDEAQGERWQLALEHLSRGGQVLFGDLVLYLERDGPRGPEPSSPLVVEIEAPPWWREGMPDNAAAAMNAELAAAKERLRLAEDASSEFATLLEGRETIIELVDDYARELFGEAP